MAANSSFLPKARRAYKQFGGYLRRQSPWLLAAALLVLFIPFTVYVLPWFTQWLFDAKPVVSGGPDLSAAQEGAAQQAISIPLGIVLSRLLAAGLYFFVTVGIVWSTMKRILPALPKWAKENFTTEFNNLPPSIWKFVIYLLCWDLLLRCFTAALHAASLVQ